MSTLPSSIGDEAESVTSSSSSSSGTLSDRQEKLIALLPILPTILSLIGSSTIIYIVISTSKKKKLIPYERLLFGMSICDILCSWVVPFWMFLSPKETSQRVWAFGNDITCTALGFFTQITFAAILYNCMISYYFLLTVRFGYKEDTIAKWIEPTMHFIAFGYPMTCTIVGTILGVYHEVELGPGCWVNNYPDNCGVDSPEQSGEKCLGLTISWIFGGVIMIVVIISLIVNNILIYCFVRKTIRQSSRIQRTAFLSRRMIGIGGGGGNNSTNDTTTTDDGTTTTKKLKNNNKNKKRKKRIIRNENQERRIRLVATQAFLYVGGFLLSYIWTIILRMLASMGFNSNDEQLLFPILVLQGIFLPFQGFINLFVYLRPNYLRNRKSYPREGIVWAIRRSIFGEDHIKSSILLSTSDSHGAASNSSISFLYNSWKKPMSGRSNFDGNGSSGHNLRFSWNSRDTRSNNNVEAPDATVTSNTTTTTTTTNLPTATTTTQD